MYTLTVKIPPSLDEALAQASERTHINKSELVRRALDLYLREREQERPFVSALDRVGDLVGCFAGGPQDLSSNPEHLAGFGRI